LIGPKPGGSFRAGGDSRDVIVEKPLGNVGGKKIPSVRAHEPGLDPPPHPTRRFHGQGRHIRHAVPGLGTDPPPGSVRALFRFDINGPVFRVVLGSFPIGERGVAAKGDAVSLFERHQGAPVKGGGRVGLKGRPGHQVERRGFGVGMKAAELESIGVIRRQ
jgi:hypothetical protein